MMRILDLEGDGVRRRAWYSSSRMRETIQISL